MEINLTFCVQVVNFLIFYHGVSRFFLRPFVEFIQAKMASRERMLEDFAAKEVQLKKLVHARTDLGQQFRQMLKDEYEQPTPVTVRAPEEKPPVALSKPRQEEIATTLTTQLVTRIRNAY